MSESRSRRTMVSSPCGAAGACRLVTAAACREADREAGHHEHTATRSQALTSVCRSRVSKNTCRTRLHDTRVAPPHTSMANLGAAPPGTPPRTSPACARHAADVQQVVEGRRPHGRHLAQRGVVEYHVGGHALPVGDLPTQRAQVFEQGSSSRSHRVARAARQARPRAAPVPRRRFVATPLPDSAPPAARPCARGAPACSVACRAAAAPPPGSASAPDTRPCPAADSPGAPAAAAGCARSRRCGRRLCRRSTGRRAAGRAPAGSSAPQHVHHVPHAEPLVHPQHARTAPSARPRWRRRARADRGTRRSCRSPRAIAPPR